MNKHEYILAAIKEHRYIERGWLLSTFGILPLTTHEKAHEIGIKTKDGILYVNVENKHDVIIDDYKPGFPLFGRKERLTLKSNDLKCLRSDVLTTYGILITNLLLIEYPYQGLTEYINKKISSKYINNIAAELLRTDKVPVEKHLLFENAITLLNVLSSIVVPTGTEKSFTPNPEIKQRKAELLAKVGDNIKNPSEMAKLQEELSKLDEEYLKGDPAARFFIGGKSKASRLRVHGTFGVEQDFIDESKFHVMTDSLQEGWKIKDIPMGANIIRGGSFHRGASTALAGNDVKTTTGVFQNYDGKIEDCLTSRGLDVTINTDNYKEFEGKYIVGNDKPLTIEFLHSNINKNLLIRSAATCEGKGTSYCKKCLGDKVSNCGIAIPALMMTMVSSFLTVFLKLSHTSSMTTARYNYLNRIT